MRSGAKKTSVGAHPYNKDLQSPPIRPVGFTPMRGYMENGDSTFFARRGYVHAVFNVRGTGKSEGFYQLMGPVEVEDICHLLGGELCGVAPRRRHSRHKLRRQLAQPPVRHAPAARHIVVGELPGL